MNALLELIDRRILQNDKAVKIIPCVVVKNEPAQYVRVMDLSTQSVYVVLNESGSNVEVGETVQVAYSGLLTNHSGYIIASRTKSSEGRYVNVSGTVYTGTLFTTSRPVCGIGINAQGEVNCVLHFSCNISAETDGTVEFEVQENSTIKTYKPKLSVTSGYSSLSFTAPLVLTGDENEVWVTARGEGIITDIQAFVGGHGIERYDLYDVTEDNDYVYRTANEKSDIIYYKGNPVRPRIPLTLGDSPIDKLYSTSFNYADVEAVYIPEGITEIR